MVLVKISVKKILRKVTLIAALLLVFCFINAYEEKSMYYKNTVADLSFVKDKNNEMIIEAGATVLTEGDALIYRKRTADLYREYLFKKAYFVGYGNYSDAFILCEDERFLVPLDELFVKIQTDGENDDQN